MELNTIKEIKQLGKDQFIEKYKLRSKDYGHKFNLKYDQLNTPKTKSTNECRGLILSNDLEVISMPFVRFSNYEENSRTLIDWETARYFSKEDGTLIQYHFDPITNKWCVGTTGTAEAVDKVASRDKINRETNSYDFDLTELFFNTCKNLNIDLTLCEKGYTYIFELATKYNMVINHYESDKVVLTGARNLSTLKELPQSDLDIISELLKCERPKEYFFDSEQEMIESLKKVKHGDINFEGYVVVDDKFNRVKVKSNTYVIYHQFNGDISSKWRLVDIVLNNEIEEVSAHFPELKDKMLSMKDKWEKVIVPIEETFNSLKERYDSLERKDFFTEGQKAANYDKNNKPLLSVYTALLNDRDITFENALNSIKRKSLFKVIN